MREIKFRAWDKKKIHSSVNFTDSDCGRRYRTRAYMIGGGELLNNEETILMQYTGLKDKNGKEIYEGDIFMESRPIYDHVHEYKCFNRDKKEIYSKTDNEYFKVVIGEIRYSHYSGFGVYASNLRNNRTILVVSPEIISNIYENPELLTNKS